MELTWLAEYSQQVRSSYGVDPRIFLGLVVVSMPPFYIAFAIVVRRFTLLRLTNTHSPAGILHDRIFASASAVVAVAWILPYAYVALFGRGLPWWAWAGFALVVAIGFFNLISLGHARTARTVGAGEVTNERTGILWDIYATTYDSLPRYLPSYTRMLNIVCAQIEASQPARGKVLDVGCGTGNYTVELAKRGFQSVGLDGSAPMLARAQRKATAASLDAQFIKVDLTKSLPFDDAEFDTIISVMVLYALPDPAALLRELRRVARPKCCLVLVTTDDRSLLLPAIRELLNEYRPLKAMVAIGRLVSVGALNAIIDTRFGKQYRGYSVKELTAILHECNWKVEVAERCYIDDAALMLVARAI